MKKADIMQKVSRTANAVGFTVKKYSPEIFVAAGVIGVVASTVLACNATTKVSAVIEANKKDIENVHKAVEDGEIVTENGVVEYTEEDCKNDIRIIRVQTGVKLAKLYAPAVALGTLSIASILMSHNILRKRNVALAAAYAAVDQGFKDYRHRVVERFGEAVDRELKYNLKAKKVDEIVVDEETGKEKKVKKTIEVTDGKAIGPYARFFDVGNKYWEKNADYNFMFLRAEQNWANDALRSRGHLFLNDVLVRLGFDKTPEGQIVGWVYDPEYQNGDNYVDFGIYDMTKETTRDFIEGLERTILLDFNVDGDIWSLMKNPRYHEKFTNA